MIVHDRRNFLKGGSFIVGALAAGSPAASAASARPDAIPPSRMSNQSAGFGWELCNLCCNGADAYFEVRNNMILEAVDVDVSAAILNDTPTGFAEVLCLGGISQQGPPAFTDATADYIKLPPSTNFGPGIPSNPNDLEMVGDERMLQNRFLAVILKTWVPPGGAASATSRHVSASPHLNISAGDYLVFHMDHAGVPVDAEMQVILTYQVA